MQIHFLGGATTVTGSQHLLITERAKVLIDCGMFQGSPNESIRNRIPFAYDPKELDAVLLTHAHLDHCGLLPLLVKDGYRGPIHATAGTIELAGLVLLDSGKLHEEFAKREARWEKRHPDKVAADDRKEADEYEAAVELAAAGDAGATTASDAGSTTAATAPAAATAAAADAASAAAGDEDTEHVATTVEPVPGNPPTAWPSDPEAQLRAQPPDLQIDLDAPLYTAKDAEASLASFKAVSLRRGGRGRAGCPRDVRGRRATSSARRSSGCGSRSTRAARSGSSSAPATSAVPTRRSCAIRRS